MFWYTRMALGMAVCLAGVPAVAPEPAAKKAKVELRWVETKKIEGVTENKGFQASCDPKGIVYPHKKPALVLTSADLTEVTFKEHDFTGNGLLGENYMVTLHLTKEARKNLAATCKGNEMKLLTVVVDGKCWGVHRYEKDPNKPLVPAAARAETFTPDVGFFSSRTDAERVVDAFK